MIDTLDEDLQEIESIEKQRSYYKKTEIGTYLLLGGFSLSILATIATPRPCMGALIGLASLGLIIAGFVMLLAGCGGFPRSHRIFLLISLILLIAGFVISLGVGLIGGIISSLGIISNPEKITGEDLRDMYKSTIPILYISILPAFMISVGYVLALYKITTKAGKAVLISFLVLSVVFIVISPVLREEAIRDVVDDIDPDREYEVEEISDTANELTMRSYPIQILASLPEILLVVAALLTALRIRSLVNKKQ